MSIARRWVVLLGWLAWQALAAQPPAGADAAMVQAVPPPDAAASPAEPGLGELPDFVTIDNFGKGAISGDLTTGVRFEGPGVKVTGDNGLEIFANSMLWDPAQKTLTFDGNVSVYRPQGLQRGQRAVYFYERKHLDTTGLRALMDPILLESGTFEMSDHDGRAVYTGYNAGVTTHDEQNPDFWVRAKKIVVFPDEKVVFHNLTVRAGDTPVFWFPYLSQPLKADLGYRFVPGARSNWGPFLLNTYGIMLGGQRDPDTGENRDAWLLSRWRFDVLAARGIGTGVDLVDTRKADRELNSGLSLYYLNDLDPQKSRSSIPRGVVNEDRYRIQLKRRDEPGWGSSDAWRIDTNLTFLSDEHFLGDFDPRRYSTDPEPDNTLGIYRRDDRSLLSILGRLRINDFYHADTRLPEITYDQSRGNFFGLPVMHEGTTSAGWIGEQAPDVTQRSVINPLMNLTSGDPNATELINQLDGYQRRLAESLVALPLGDPRREAIRTQLADSQYARFRTYHQWSAPVTVMDVVHLAPEAGAGYSNYFAIDGQDDDLDRSHVHVGMEASLKFSKDGPTRNHGLGLDGIRHVVQPYSRWSWVTTDDFEPGDPGVDRLSPTTRPRPLDPMRFTAVDEMNSWNVLRFGTRNRWITRRDQRSHEWLYLDTYIDAFLDDPEEARDYSGLYNDLRWQPVPWISFGLESQLPISGDSADFSEWRNYLRFMPDETWTISLGYNHLSGHPLFVDSNRLHLQLYKHLNEDWGVDTRHTFEMDDGVMEEQRYTLHRDLGNWVAAMGVSARDNRFEEEYGLVFTLTLKDFPSVSLPFDIDAP